MDTVRILVADEAERFTFFCGGSRNVSTFQDVFDGIFVLDIDTDTLNRRLGQRPEGEFGARQEERDLIRTLHRTRQDIPQNGVIIDATAPLDRVVDEIVRLAISIETDTAGRHARSSSNVPPMS